MIHELIVDAYDCAGDLNDPKALIATAKSAVTKVGARIAGETFHQFQPHGLTICLILQESHFIVSTWPEHSFAVVNIFLCNPSMDARRVWEEFATVIQPGNVVFHQVRHKVPTAIEKMTGSK